MNYEKLWHLMENKSRIDITQERGHWAAYIDGEEYCTGDTYLEVIQELTEDGYL